MKLGYRYYNGQLQFRPEKPNGKGASCLIRNCLGVPRDMRADIREVCAVATPEQYRGLGLATNLLNGVCLEADNNNKTLLITIDKEGRDKLHAFYQKFGFAVIEDGQLFMMMRNPNATEVLLNVG